jgi:Fe-S cluster biosynthesis and repair protein YggX
MASPAGSRYFQGMTTVSCVRCGQTREQMAFRPFQNELGLRAFDQICAVCWSEWLKYQQQLINHYGLDLRSPEAKTFLFEQMETYLFSPAPPR